jgi:S1-C subfamily serine protease
VVWWGSQQTAAVPEIETASQAADRADENPSEPTAGIWDPALFAPPSNLEGTIDRVEEALLDIYCGEDYGGTGWLIDTDREPIVRKGQEVSDAQLYDGLALTAWHVVEECTGDGAEMIVYRGQRAVPAVLLNWHKKTDVAVLAVELDRPGLTVAMGAPLGSWSMTAGYPLSDKPTPVFGSVIGKEEFQIYTQMPIRPGHSGSPLVNSLGEAIGVVTSVPLDEESGEPYGWTLSTTVVALCEKLFECPAGDIEGLRD